MKEIKITEENKQIYKELLNAKLGIIESKNNKLATSMNLVLVYFTLLTCLCALPVCLATLIRNIIFLFKIEISVYPYLLITMGSWIASVALFFKYGESITTKILINKFIKKYPNFDTNCDVNELKKELEKYELLSKIPKDLEKQQEEHLNKFDHNFKEMSPEEKINLLETEKKFWEQVKQQQELTTKSLESNEKTVQKKIGTK